MRTSPSTASASSAGTTASRCRSWRRCSPAPRMDADVVLVQLERVGTRGANDRAQDRLLLLPCPLAVPGRPVRRCQAGPCSGAPWRCCGRRWCDGTSGRHRLRTATSPCPPSSGIASGRPTASMPRSSRRRTPSTSTGQRRCSPASEPGFFLCVARLLPYKNVDAVVAAFRELPQERLVVVGTGPEGERLSSSRAQRLLRGHGRRRQSCGGCTETVQRWCRPATRTMGSRRSRQRPSASRRSCCVLAVSWTPSSRTRPGSSSRNRCPARSPAPPTPLAGLVGRRC